MKARWTIGKKLILSFMGVAIITLIVGIIGFYGVTRLGDSLTVMGHDRVPALRAFFTLNTYRNIIRAQTNEVWQFDHGNKDTRENFRTLLTRRKNRWKEIDVLWEDVLKVHFRTPEAQKAHNTLKDQYKAWRENYVELDSIIERLSKTKDPKEKANLFDIYEQVSERMKPISDAMGATADFLTKNNVEVTNQLIEDDAVATTTLKISSIITVILGFFLALILGLVISGRIARPVKRMTDLLEPLSRGDLTVKIDVESNDEIGIMAEQFTLFIEKLSSVLRNIIENTQQVLQATGEVSQGNQDLSQRVNSQSAALEETASAIEEMTANIKSMSDNAGVASKLGTETQESANKGEEDVQKTVAAMQVITEKTERIQDIIKIIDNIAFQTNILALNAAVEAARAKEHGKGFAVVANEVRNLAQKSAENAKQISTMIEEIVRGIQNGNQLVGNTQVQFLEIKSKIEKTTSIINEVAASAAEQNEGIDQINHSVVHLDEITQANASLVEEVAASSEELESQSRGIIDLMRFFKLEEEKQAFRQKNTNMSKGKETPKETVKAQPSKKEFSAKKEEARVFSPKTEKKESHLLSKDGFTEF